MMRIFVLEPTEAGWDRIKANGGKHATHRFVIAARSTGSARALARSYRVDDPSEVWVDRDLSTCTAIGAAWHVAVPEQRVIAQEATRS